MPKKKNFLIITSDQQRWDTIGLLNPKIKTPNLDRLARMGILFERGYTVNPVCTPSRVSILTGQYPSRHGCYHVGTNLPEDYGPLLSGEFARQGYFTGLLGKAHFKSCLQAGSFEAIPRVLDSDFFRNWKGPYYGFEYAKLVIGHTSEKHSGAMHYGAWLEDQGIDLSEYFGIHPYSQYGAWKLPEELHGSKWVADETITAIDKAGKEGKPFLLWSSFQDPHNPYVCPQPWASMYEPDDLDVPDPEERNDAGKPDFYKSLTAGKFYGEQPEMGKMHNGDVRVQPEMGKKDIAELYAAYYGMVSLMDRHIGRILDKLETDGLLDSTVIVFTSDHGDYLGRHGLWGKGLPAFEDMQRVPFIVYHPDCKTPGKRSQSLQSLVDISPSFLAELEPGSPAGALRSEAGEGLVPPGNQGIVQGNAWLDASERSRHWAMVEFQPGQGPFIQRTYIEDQYKLVFYHPVEYGELYDIKKDPDQRENLYERSGYKELRDRLIAGCLRAELEKDGTMLPRTAFA